LAFLTELYHNPKKVKKQQLIVRNCRGGRFLEASISSIRSPGPAFLSLY